MNHLFTINQLSNADCRHLLNRANAFKNDSNYPTFPGLSLANLFYEPSTRTRISFEMAAKNLGIRVVNVDFAQSSESKGETISDTIQTLHAMGIQYFVLRHCQNGLIQTLAETLPQDLHLINAGDGTHEHPSQALLDIMTIQQSKPDLARLKIAIVGNILHSRVANSLQKICALMGVGELVFIAPEIWHPKTAPAHASLTSSLQEGLAEADVVIALRIQKERLANEEQLDLATYHARYAITAESLAWAKADVMVMHPGPMNRGIEIDTQIADGTQSYILEQVKNGVFMRMAILEFLGL
jgi:aspartate carbamoyltransferase catalytic subunit